MDGGREGGRDGGIHGWRDASTDACMHMNSRKSDPRCRVQQAGSYQ